jgi:urea carboxylase
LTTTDAAPGELISPRTAPACFEVLRPGPQTTVQDGGRPGYLSKGIPPSGPQDHASFALASRLVGNAPVPPPLSLGDPGDAGLEILFQGPKLAFLTDALIALTGAEFPMKIDGEPAPMWTAILVRAGSVLDVGSARRGLRGYLAIAGGIDVPQWLGSRATYIRGLQGGFEGRALRKGDRVSRRPMRPDVVGLEGARVPASAIPDLDAARRIRVVLGPQDHLVTERSLEEFLTADWQLTPSSDRMGFRLNGPVIEFRERPAYLVRDAGSLPSNIVLDVSPLGGIQVTAGPEAIIVGVDLPSIGGFAKPATVISADMSRIGQVRPGETIRFEPVDVDEAVRIGRAQAAAANDVELER